MGFQRHLRTGYSQFNVVMAAVISFCTAAITFAKGSLREKIGWLMAVAVVIEFEGMATDFQFQPKVIIVSTFEIGADTGDKPGEFQFWVEREGLTNSVRISGMDHAVRYRDDGLFGCVSGTTVRCAEQLLLLGIDPRFDFTHTYWLINGIAGVNPEYASVGSAAWARWVVDGDLAYEIDVREIPSDWPYGILPLGGREPNKAIPPPPWAPKPMAWELDAGLVQWAYGLSKNTPIPDSPAAILHRRRFTSWPAAQLPARVILGECLASGRYWHGLRQNQWASDWVRIQTRGEGRMAMSDMEDHGLLSALHRLSSIGRTDARRILVLRTGSNYTVPHPGQSASESLHEDYAGMRPALEAAYLAGSVVVHSLLSDWPRYRDHLPVEASP